MLIFFLGLVPTSDHNHNHIRGVYVAYVILEGTLKNIIAKTLMVDIVIRKSNIFLCILLWLCRNGNVKSCADRRNHMTYIHSLYSGQ